MTAEHPKRVIYSLEAPQTVIYSIFTVFNVICSAIELRVLIELYIHTYILYLTRL